MLNDLMQTWNDPHARHAMLIHWPIVLAVLGAAPLLGLAYTKWKSTPMKVVCIAWFVVLSGVAWFAAEAGEDATGGVYGSTPPLTSAEANAVHEHEELGESGWLWALIPVVFTFITFAPNRRLRMWAGIAAIIAALGVAGWAITTAHAGGKLVYEYGLGVPKRVPVESRE